MDFRRCGLLPEIPSRFCWTKFGSEAGEGVEAILTRKEQERAANHGIFMWGIGNSVAPGIRALLGLESNPSVIFSPMRSKPKAIDAAPGRVVNWGGARGLDGQKWNIPPGSSVTSRGESGNGVLKRTHYALVCRALESLPISGNIADAAKLSFGSLTNLVSGSPVGYSQVTSVVGYRHSTEAVGPSYTIGFRAWLVYPYFVELFDPGG
jgi:hypothetical protein